jgi:predicted MFS family arabinose efflux permease
MLSFALVFQSVPPLLSLIVAELHISDAQAGLLMGLFALPGIFISIPGRLIADHFGTKKIGVISLILMIIGTFVVGVSNSFLFMCFGRLISGIGGLTLAVVLPQLLSRWFIGKELGIGMGIFNTAMPLGTIASLNALSIVGKSFGWHTSVFLTTIACIFALLTFLLLFREPPTDTKKTINEAFTNVIKLGFPIWLVSIAWMCFNAAFISFLTFAPKFLAEKGYEVSSAGFISSIIMMGSLTLSPIVGYLMHKFGKEEVFIGVGGVVLAFLIFFVPTSSTVIPLFILIGIFAALVPAPIFSLPPKIVESKNLGLGFGILTTCLNVGILAGPYFAGLAKDSTGEYSLSFYLMSLFAVLQTVTIGLSKMRRRAHVFRE